MVKEKSLTLGLEQFSSNPLYDNKDIIYKLPCSRLYQIALNEYGAKPYKKKNGAKFFFSLDVLQFSRSLKKKKNSKNWKE